MHRKAQNIDSGFGTGQGSDESQPLSELQWGIWLGTQRIGKAPGHHMVFTFTLAGHIDIDAFRRAFQAILNRFDALRIVIEYRDGLPRQRALPPFRFDLGVVDLSKAPGSLVEWVNNRIRHPLMLEKRLFDSALIRQSSSRFVWYLNIHHLIADGWSYELIYRVMAKFYMYACHGTIPCDSPGKSFITYVSSRDARGHERTITHHSLLSPGPLILGDLVPEERRLRKTLSGEQMLLLNRFMGDRTAFHIDLARIQVFTTVLLVWLHQTTRRSQITVGIPFHGRRTESSRSVVGLLQRTLPVTVEIGDNETFASLRQKVAGQIWDGIRGNGNGRHCDADASEILINYPNVSFPDFAGVPVQASWVHPGYGDGHRRLFVQVHDFNQSGRLTIDFDANEGCFSILAHRRMADQVLFLFERVLAQPEKRLFEFDRMPSGQWAEVVRTFNNTNMVFPSEKTLADLFEAQAETTPQSVAVVHGNTTLQYANLNARANRLAHRLRAAGIGPGMLVAVCAAPSVNQLVGLLAIFKVGGGYLPLDPAYPRKRLAFMLSDARVHLLLLEDRYRGQISEPGIETMSLDSTECKTHPTTNPERAETAASDIAYVVYTSGSTGTPKGVAMPQRAMANLITWQIRKGTRLDCPRTLQFTPLSFDVSLQEIFATWCAGGTLVVPEVSTRRDPESTLRLLIEENIEQLFVIYTPMKHLAEAANRLGLYPSRLREVITAGEQVHVTPAIRRFFEHLPECSFQNQYGPSETHIVTRHLLSGPPTDWKDFPSIGRAIANTQIYLLDLHRRPVPKGCEGELYIGGAQVADGYLHRPEWTAQRFVPDPFHPVPGSRMYRTGDLGMFDEEGRIQFLGRIDHQVKVRGYRIEPGEIEAVLNEHPLIQENVVVARGKREKRLVAYCVPGSEAEPSIEELRRLLSSRLPNFMVPSFYIMLSSIPRLPNGKLDRDALPAPGTDRPVLESVIVPPSTPTEQAIAGVWRSVLHLNAVGINDSFFDLGGDSLSLLQVHQRLREQGIELDVVDLFTYPTPAALATRIDKGSGKQSVIADATGRAQKRRAARKRRMIKRGEIHGKGDDPFGSTHRDEE